MMSTSLSVVMRRQSNNHRLASFASKRPLSSSSQAAPTTEDEAVAATGAESLFYEEDVSTTTSTPGSIGKYCKIGHLVMENEVPRNFEKTEWSTSMLRTNPLTPEQLKQQKEYIPDRGGRWDPKPLVDVDDRRLLIRQCGVTLCKDLELAGEGKTPSFARLLTGNRGLGKSAALLHALTWARASGWLTMFMPRASNLVTPYGAFFSGTGGPIAILPESSIGQGLFQQPNAAKELLETTAELHGEALALLPQRRTYKHDLYKAKQSGSGTLAHIMMRGLSQPHRAADALYDLRMEFNLVEEVPVLIVVDEFNALYWPTSLFFQLKAVKAHELVMAKAFRFINHVPGDIEDDDNPKTVRQAKVNEMHVPKRGAVLAASTRSMEAPAHKEQLPPARFEKFTTRGVDYFNIPRYDEGEIAKAMQWYQIRGVCKPQSEEMLGRTKVFTAGVPEKVAQYALGSTMGVDALFNKGK